MSINLPLSLLVSNPELFKYYNVEEISAYADKQHGIQNNTSNIEKFIKTHLKKNIEINDGKGNSTRFKDAIAKALGYNNFGDLRNKHTPYREKIKKQINNIDIPDTNELIGQLGGWTTDKYTDEKVRSAVLKTYPELIILYESIDSLFDDIGLRKNSIVENIEIHNRLETYCFLQVIKRKPFMFFEEKPTESSNYDIIMLSLFAHKIINLPGPWSNGLTSSKNDINNIDYHHELEERNKFLEVRFKTGLLTDRSNIIFTSPAKKNRELFDRMFSKYKDVADGIESDLDYTIGDPEILPNDYPSGGDYYRHLGIDKKTLVRNFYHVMEEFDNSTIKDNIYGLEYLRIALILLTSIDKHNIFSRLGKAQPYLIKGFDLLNPEIDSVESYKEQLPQFI